jgi:hypothetical protein
MDLHDYITGELVNDRLVEMRAYAANERLFAAHRRPRPPVRVAVGGALIRLGSWLVGAEVKPGHEMQRAIEQPVRG